MPQSDQRTKSSKAKSARNSKKERVKRKKSARGDSPRRTKSSQQKGDTASVMPPGGVSDRLYSSQSAHVTAFRSHTAVMESKASVPVHTQVFPAPFANGGPGMVLPRFQQQHGLPKYVYHPAHMHVVKHPLPFR